MKAAFNISIQFAGRMKNQLGGTQNATILKNCKQAFESGIEKKN